MAHGQASMFSVGGGETKYRFESARALPASSDEWLNGAVPSDSRRLGYDMGGMGQAKVLVRVAVGRRGHLDSAY